MDFKNASLFFALTISVASLPACSSDDGDGGNTAPAGPIDVKVDTFNIGLAGAFLPNSAERTLAMPDALAASDADILCLQEVWLQSDKDAILSATKSQFPYTVSFKHDLSTPVDDPTDQNGQVPPPRTTPPCGAADIDVKVQAAIDCIRDKCSTIMGSDEGFTTSTDCAQKNCLTEATALLFGTPEELTCYGCLAASLPTEKLSDIRSQCTTDPNAGLAFGGQSGVVILSKFPLAGSEAWVIPGTYNRRVIINATANLPNGAKVDVFCNHLSPMFKDFTRPYVGDYGEGKTTAEGWSAEQLLQSNKLIAYVNAKSGSRPAIILGDFNSGREYSVGGQIVANEESSATLDRLESVFLPAVAADYVPACTYCSTNANNDTSSPDWIDHIFLFNKTAADVKSTQRVYDQDVVPVDDGGSTVNVPLSDHYGLRAVLTFAP